jgi:ABC-type nitrate/sulfonate/bicarbonate transport system substrate-binding protein
VKCIRIALDWTPNAIHVGLLLARYSGAYRKSGLDVILESPEEDQYLNTPMKKLVNGQIHIAIAPTDSVISYRTLHKEYPVVSIAAIQQQHNSAIATLAESGICRPAELDGKVYGSYGARFEDAIIRHMVRDDGGNGMLRIVRPPKLSMWDALLEGEIDATWIFLPWEGALAKARGKKLNLFKPEDYGVPYATSPLMITTERLLDRYPAEFRLFMQITKAHYEWAAKNPKDAAHFLVKAQIHPSLNQSDTIAQTLDMLAPALLDKNGEWGSNSIERSQVFCNWLEAHDLICDPETEMPVQVSQRCSQWFSNAWLNG